MMPVRVQLSRAKGWRMPPNTIKVDRTSLFGNPFAVRKGAVSGGPERWVNMPRYFAGDVLHFATKVEAAGKAVEMFRNWINHPALRKQREMMIVGCRGVNLACWCKPGEPCHADVLLEIANDVHGVCNSPPNDFSTK